MPKNFENLYRETNVIESYQADPQNLEEIEALKQKINELEAQNNQLLGENIGLQSQINHLNTDIAQSAEQLKDFSGQLEKRVIERTQEIHFTTQKIYDEALELERTKLALEKTTDTLTAILRNTSQAFVLLDPAYNVIALSKATVADPRPGGGFLEVGDNMLDYLQVKYRQYFIDSFNEVLAGNTIVRERESYQPDDVTRLGWYEYIYNPIFDEAGKVVSVLLAYQIIEQRKQAELKVIKNAERMHLLAEITQAVSQVGLDYQAVLDLTTKRIAEFFKCVCSVFMLSENKNRLSFTSAFSTNPLFYDLIEQSQKFSYNLAFPIEQPILANEIKAKDFFLSFSADLHQLLTELPQFFELFINTIIIPMFNQGKIIGFLVVVSDDLNQPYLEEDAKFLEEVADRVTLAIENVNLLRELKSRDQLEAVHALARTLAHDLTQPLTILQGELDFILQLGEPPNQEVLQIMQTAVTAITNKIREYQKIVRYRTTLGPIGQMIE
jgi:GAF domain-containing protein